MNKRILISLVMAGALIAGSAVAGPQDGRDRGPRHGGPDMAPQVIEHLTHAIRTLDLSDEQRDSIHSELQGLRESMKPLVQSMQENRKELRDLVTADVYDSAAVTATAEEQGAITAQMTILASAAAANVLASLDEQQRAQLKGMADKRQEHRADHRDWANARKNHHRDRKPGAPPEDS